MDEKSLKRRDVLKGVAGTGALATFSGTAAGEYTELWQSDGDQGEYVVGIDPDHEKADDARSNARGKAVSLRREIDLGDVRDVVAGVYTEKEVTNLREEAAVDYVEKDFLLEPTAEIVPEDDLEPEQSVNDGEYPWGIKRVGATQAHENGNTGDGVDIVIIDSGIESDHPSLEGNLGAGKYFGNAACVEEDRQYSQVECVETWDDDQHHGTHVAGTAGAVDRAFDDGNNPTVQVERIAGVAPGATIHAANVFEWKVINGQWAILAPSSNTADAIKWAADQDYDVVNASLGGPDPSAVIEDALEYATNEHNLVFVSSAGNDGNACGQDPYSDDPDDCVGYPAAFDDAIAVGNTTIDDEIAASSSRGPEVEIAAPGSTILSAMPTHVKFDSDTVDGDHWWLNGTSMAAPHVAGLAALIKGETSIDDNEKIREQITNTAEDLGLRAVETGNGLIDVQAALDVQIEELSVSTLDATTVEGTQATLEGQVDSLGGASEADVSFEYWIQGEDGTQTTSPQTVSQTGSFQTTVSGLEADTTYVYKAIVETGSETTEGSETTFTTLPILTVTTRSATNFKTDEATLRGNLQSLGTASQADVSFEYWVEGENQTQTTSAKTVSDTGKFETTVTGLDSDTTYVYRALAETADGTDTGSEVTFVTVAETVDLPTVDLTQAADAVFKRRDEVYTIEAAGVSRTSSERDKEYGAIYRDDVSGNFVARTTVLEQENTNGEATAGLRVANDVTAGTGSAGDLLVAATPGAGFVFAWDDNGDGTLDQSIASEGPASYPCELRVEKTATEFTAAFSTDGGETWTELDTVTISDAAATQDVGVSTTSESSGERSTSKFDQFGVGDVLVGLEPAELELAQGTQETVDLAVEHATGGISSYTATISVADTSVTEITDYSLTNSPESTNVTLAEDGSSLELNVNMGTNAHDPGDVKLAEVTVDGVAVGGTDLSLDNLQLTDTNGHQYTIATATGSNVTVAEDLGPPPISGDTPPRDLDDDGLYEDVDGDGELDIFDVQVLFSNLDSDVVQNNPAAFNFDGTENPQDVDIFDVQALFSMVQNQQ